MGGILTLVLMNLTVPGSGLILLGRAWLGFALAIWFCLAAVIAVSGRYIAPVSIPWGVTAVAAALALMAWLIGQGLLVSRIRCLRGRLPGALFSVKKTDT
ncbi:MAG TPA: hypothetical protein PLL20_15785 [Phycisphaerae bacterium]|nr:hypothetical protein [Phycisphaerae bacterium]HRR85258.1 hypothetical protein [Phycisphaerae bacterium]